MKIERQMFILKYDNLQKLNTLLDDGWEINQLSSCANPYGYVCYVYLERRFELRNNKPNKKNKETLPDNVEDLPF